MLQKENIKRIYLSMKDSPFGDEEKETEIFVSQSSIGCRIGLMGLWTDRVSSQKTYSELLSAINELYYLEKDNFNKKIEEYDYRLTIEFKDESGDLDFYGTGKLYDHYAFKYVAEKFAKLIPQKERYPIMLNPVLGRADIVKITKSTIEEFKNSKFLFLGNEWDKQYLLTDEYVLLVGSSSVPEVQKAIGKLYCFDENNNFEYMDFVPLNRKNELWYMVMTGSQCYANIFLRKDFFEQNSYLFSHKVSMNYGNFKRLFDVEAVKNHHTN